MEIPEVRIQFSWLFYESVSKILHEHYAKDGQKLSTPEQCDEWTDEYRNAWAKKEEAILKGLINVMELEFKRSIIDLDLAPWFRPTSSPLMMGFNFEPDEFVDTLTHELCHILLTDNTKFSNRNKSGRKGALLKKWEANYGDDHDWVTLVHIPVHALLKYIYLDILKEPYRLERDIKHCQKYPRYKETWEYVQANDYKEIIKLAKESY